MQWHINLSKVYSNLNIFALDKEKQNLAWVLVLGSDGSLSIVCCACGWFTDPALCIQKHT